MKVITIILVILLLMPAIALADGEEKMDIYFFYGEGCPHCAEEEPFLDKLEIKYPQIDINRYEVWNDKDNLRLMQQMAFEHGVEANGVPVTIVGDDVFVGFGSEETTGKKIEAAISNLCTCVNETYQKSLLEESQKKSQDTYINTFKANEPDLIGKITGFNANQLFKVSDSIYKFGLFLSLALLAIPMLAIKKIKKHHNRKKIRIMFLCFAIITIGLFLTFILTKNHYELKSQGDISTELCKIADGRFNCAEVESSKYSEFLDVPISIFGTCGYALIYLMLIFAWNKVTIKGFSKWMHVVFGISCFNVFIALLMAYISSFIIGAYCLFCVGTYICSGTVFYLSLRYIRMR